MHDREYETGKGTRGRHNLVAHSRNLYGDARIKKVSI